MNLVLGEAKKKKKSLFLEASTQKSDTVKEDAQKLQESKTRFTEEDSWYQSLRHINGCLRQGYLWLGNGNWFVLLVCFKPVYNHLHLCCLPF